MIIDSVEIVILIATIIILISRRACLFYLIVILTCWIQILTWRNFRNLNRPTNSSKKTVVTNIGLLCGIIF